MAVSCYGTVQSSTDNKAGMVKRDKVRVENPCLILLCQYLARHEEATFLNRGSG